MLPSVPSSLNDRLIKAISKLSEEQKNELLKFANALRLERRHFSRRPHRIDVSYSDWNRSASGVIHNLSASGLYIEPNGPFARGRKIRLFFEHPYAQKQVKLAGVIVRKDKGGIGIQFKQPLKDF